MKIYKTKTFDSAHILKLPYTSPCADSIHGHTWKIEMWINAEQLNESDMVLDFQKIGDIIDELDHKYLNDIKGLEQPTAERIVLWFIEKISEYLKKGSELRVRVWETAGAYAEDEIVVG